MFTQVNLRTSASRPQQGKQWGLEGMARLSKAAWKALGVGRARIEGGEGRTPGELAEGQERGKQAIVRMQLELCLILEVAL